MVAVHIQFIIDTMPAVISFAVANAAICNPGNKMIVWLASLVASLQALASEEGQIGDFSCNIYQSKQTKLGNVFIARRKG